MPNTVLSAVLPETSVFAYPQTGLFRPTGLENTLIDYLDSASPVSGLDSKMGFDATNKWPGETNREWGRPIVMSPDVIKKVDVMWDSLF